MRNGLAVARIAIALILLIHTKLMVRSFVKLILVTPGFRSEGILTSAPGRFWSRFPTLDENEQRLSLDNLGSVPPDERTQDRWRKPSCRCLWS